MAKIDKLCGLSSTLNFQYLIEKDGLGNEICWLKCFRCHHVGCS